MSAASPPDYPFGIPPSDPFSVATCPACGAQIGPALHHCPTCYATEDLTAARLDILFRGGTEPTIVRVVQGSLAALGVVVAVLGLALGESPVVVAGGAALALFGALGWLAYPYYPRAVGVAAATVVVLVAVSVGILVIVTPRVTNRGAVLGVLGGISLAVLRGAQAAWRVGARLGRLQLLSARPQ